MNKFLCIMLVIVIGFIVYTSVNNSNVLVATLEEESMTMEITIKYKNDEPDYAIIDYKMPDNASANQIYSLMNSLNENYIDDNEKKMIVSMPEKNVVRIEGDASIEELQFPRGSKLEAEKELKESGFKIK